jgi:hypothetical protein
MRRPGLSPLVQAAKQVHRAMRTFSMGMARTETRIASVYRDENGVIVIDMKDCGLIDEYDVMDLNLVIRQKCANRPSLKLVVATGDWDMTKKAKEIAEKEDNLSQTKARAVVVSNNIKASILNFLKTFSDKSYPQQFFNNRESAYEWLLGYKEKGLGELNIQ